MSSPSPTDLLHSSPRRPPDWVWKRAVSHVSGLDSGPSRRRDGIAGAIQVRDAVQFLRQVREYGANRDPAALCDLALDSGPVYWAYSYYSQPGPARSQIEARILARQQDSEIAAELGTTPEVIAKYVSWFFDIRDRLKNADYIMHFVIGPDIHGQVRGTDYGLLWRLYGYFLGPHVLQALVTKFHAPAFCTSESAVITALQDDMISTAKIKAALAAKTIGVSEASQYDLMKIFADTLQIETKIRGAAAGNAQLMSAIAGMFASLPYTVDGHDPQTGTVRVGAPERQRYDRAGVVLTADEQVGLRLGHLPTDPTLDELQDATFETLSREQADASG